ncbi:MAG: transposase, partial [Planctomycetes bacterium]|nr:transposase [Planctomycetota bacterium]
MLLNGHTATSVAQRLGLSDSTLLYKWKARQLEHAG